MSGRIDFVEESALFVSIEELFGSKNAETFEFDHFYVKANWKKKAEIY